MKRQIQIDKDKIEYTLKKSGRTRRLKLAVYCDGDFVVTAPRSLDENVIEEFIISKARWIIERIRRFKDNPVRNLANGSEKEYREHKAEALALAEGRIGYYNKFYGFSFNRIAIKNQKTRWGSCSKKKNLNFNYKIALLPPELSDYIIVHELCHLQEFNHSKEFWSLVGKTIPDYPERRRELRR
jgi:predicted metal-dependent hydrolase